MKTIFTVLQDIEKLIYKVLMWIILIPKTVVRIVWEPRWAAEYIRSELKEGGSQFDEYVSPVILLLVVALLPSLGYNILPKFGVTLSSPAETTLTTDRNLSFDANVDFVSSSDDLEYFVAWEVWKKGASGEFEFERSDYHNGSDEGATIVKVDHNTVRDSFRHDFTPGQYLVYASAGNADTRREDIPTLETYEAYLNVQVPDDPDAQVQVFSDTANTLDEKTTSSNKNFLDRVKEEQTIFLALALMTPPLLFAFISQMVRVKKIEKIGEETLRESFYVQCYYFSPLSLAIWGTYYAYYFFTANVYGYIQFNTALQILLLPLVWAGLWFMRTEVKRIAWELEVGWKGTADKANKSTSKKDEATSIVDEEKNSAKAESESKDGLGVVVSKKNTLISAGIVLVCIVVLVFGGRLLVDFRTYMDDVRLFAIRAFPVLALLLILGFGVSWFRRRQERKDGVFGWNVGGLVILTLAFFVVMRRVQSVADLSTPARAVAEAQATTVWIPPATLEIVQSQPTIVLLPSATPEAVTEPLLPEATSTPVVAATPTIVSDTPTPMLEPTPTAVIPTSEPSRFYVEEFEAPEDLLGWGSFMTFGDQGMVDQAVDPGKLLVSIIPLNDKYAWYYLINNNFSYFDVRVDTVVVNQGNNANGISLICRHSTSGWYEFVLSNDGTYSIFAVDQQGYNEIANGGSARIRTGRQTNEYTAICSGNELILIINGTEVRRLTETKYQFPEGRIGLAVSAMKRLPVSVDFESLTVSEP